MFSNRDLRRLLIPLVLEQLLSGLMGIADTMMVTRVGDTAISAVSCVDSINTLVLYVLSALATGGTIICAQYLGRKERVNAIEAARQVYLVALAFAVAMAAVAVIFRRGLLGLIFGRVEEAIMSQAVRYFGITALSYPFLALQQVSAAQFRAGGNSRLPMLTALGADSLNIVGNAVLIFGLGMGVTGAALSTLACRAVSALVLLICQRKPTNPIPFRDYRTIRPRGSLILSVCRIAVPTGLEQGLFQLGRLLVQSTVSTLGTTAIAAQAMTLTLDTFQSLPSQAIGMGLLTVVGQCIGAGRLDEVRLYTGKLTRICWVVRAATDLLVLAATLPVCRISGLSADASVLTFRMVLWITIASALFWIPSFCLPNTLRAAGDVTFCATVSAVSMWIFRVGLSALLCRVLGFGLEGIWLAWFTDWVCRMICYIARYRSDAWTRKNVLARDDSAVRS